MTDNANKHGGARPGAGRKKGSKNRNQQVESLLEKYPLTPLELLLHVVNDENQPIARRLKAAKAALPYIHARLAPASAEDLEPEPHYSLDLTKLSDEQLMQYEELFRKAAVRVDDLN